MPGSSAIDAYAFGVKIDNGRNAVYNVPTNPLIGLAVGQDPQGIGIGTKIIFDHAGILGHEMTGRRDARKRCPAILCVFDVTVPWTTNHQEESKNDNENRCLGGGLRVVPRSRHWRIL